MDFANVQQQLNDLPPTFKRPGAPYTQIIDAQSAGLTRYCDAATGLSAQTQFQNAVYGWLDLWGLLFGIPRLPQESDAHYKNRIQYEVNAGAGPQNAIAQWIQVVWGVSATIQEQPLPGVGYSITFNASLTTAQIIQILISIGRIRPAGVPILNIGVVGIGTYLDTINFLEVQRVTGQYLTGGTVPVGALLPGPCTNNAQPLIPDLYLTDPTLNPG
jgi:hypothetical protein